MTPERAVYNAKMKILLGMMTEDKHYSASHTSYITHEHVQNWIDNDDERHEYVKADTMGWANYVYDRIKNHHD